MIIPYQVDVPMRRWPVANFVVVGGILAVFVGELVLPGPAVRRLLGAFALVGWSPAGLFGHMWLHASVPHLLGNALFLWVFGNAICAKLGNRLYPAVYVALGVAAAVVHLVITGASGAPMVGASGAINGIVGMFLVLYPANTVTCFYLLIVRPGRFSVGSGWMILLWLAFDVWGATRGGGHVAYWAHLGGFAFGFALAAALLKTGLVTMDPDERSLLAILGIRTPEAKGPSGGPSEAARPIRMYASRSTRIVPPPRPESDETRVPVGSVRPDPYFVVKCACGKELRIPKKYAGRRAMCTQCSAVIRVPEA